MRAISRTVFGTDDVPRQPHSTTASAVLLLVVVFTFYLLLSSTRPR